MSIVKKCPTCGALWTIEAEHTGICQTCGKTLQDYVEIRDAQSWIDIYRNIGQYGA